MSWSINHDMFSSDLRIVRASSHFLDEIYTLLPSTIITSLPECE